jgi:hypothetical protein
MDLSSPVTILVLRWISVTADGDDKPNFPSHVHLWLQLALVGWLLVVNLLYYLQFKDTVIQLWTRYAGLP